MSAGGTQATDLTAPCRTQIEQLQRMPRVISSLRNRKWTAPQ
jgi:hypothetical protein